MNSSTSCTKPRAEKSDPSLSGGKKFLLPLAIMAATILLMLLPGYWKDAPDARPFGRGNALLMLDQLSFSVHERAPEAIPVYLRQLRDPRVHRRILKFLETPKP